jgi:hypothetical protein
VGHHYYGNGVDKLLGPYQTIEAAKSIASNLRASMDVEVEIFKLVKVGEI